MSTFAVFFGGRSNEREISVITGMLAVNLLRSTPHTVLPVYLPPEGGMVTGKFKGPADFAEGKNFRTKPVFFAQGGLYVSKRKLIPVDAALNCCHGGAGEDGTLSALLRWYGLPSASPEAPMSAVFMDKTLTKIAARGLGLPTARAFSVSEREWLGGREEILRQASEFGYPVVVKPAALGSSIGVKVATCPRELCMALDLAFRLDGSALIEEYFKDKRDINCAACRIRGEVVLSPLEEVFSEEDILTFSEKYERGNGRTSEKPANLSEQLADEIGRYTRTLYEAFAGKGVVRADFLVSGGKVYFNELNTVPGSLSCYLFADSLTKSRDFLLSLLEEALRTPRRDKELITSGILDGDLFAGRKGGKRI